MLTNMQEYCLLLNWHASWTDIQLSMLSRQNTSVKARRSAESAVFLRDMLEYQMEYDDVVGARPLTSSKMLGHRPDYSMHSMIHDDDSTGHLYRSADSDRGRGGNDTTDTTSRRSSPFRASPLKMPSAVAPRKYLFESPSPAAGRLRGTPTSGGGGNRDEDIDYIRQLAAEEFAGLSCYALLGVARRLENGGKVGTGEREADLAFALEHSRSECVLWKAKEELARTSVSRVLHDYHQVPPARLLPRPRSCRSPRTLTGNDGTAGDARGAAARNATGLHVCT